MNLTKYYGTAEGPLGFPMTDRQAFALEEIQKALPRDAAYAYRKTLVAQGPSEVLPGERSDVSWITTEDPDRQNEVVIARGMNDSQFKLNPIVTLQHAYHLPPVGKSVWRKRLKDGPRAGIKAKTQYPARPADWDQSTSWPPDVAFALVQADLLRGKSIGFLPTRVHVPDQKERDANGWPQVALVVDDWLLLEYACTFLPAQQNAVVEAVSKSAVVLPEEFVGAMGLDAGLFQESGVRGERSEVGGQRSEIVPFTPLAEVEKAVQRRLQSLDIHQLIAERLDVARGRV